MDFSMKQYDSLSLRYYKGAISHKENFIRTGPIQG